MTVEAQPALWILFLLGEYMCDDPCVNFFKNILCQVSIVREEQGGNSIATVVLRGSTESIWDDLETAVEDRVNTYKASSMYYLSLCQQGNNHP